MNIPNTVMEQVIDQFEANPIAKVTSIPHEDGWWLISRDGRSLFTEDWAVVEKTAPRWARLQGGIGETPAEQLADGPGTYTPAPKPLALPGDEPSAAVATALRAAMAGEVSEDA
jgi:hypothetical protein